MYKGERAIRHPNEDIVARPKERLYAIDLAVERVASHDFFAELDANRFAVSLRAFGPVIQTPPSL